MDDVIRSKPLLPCMAVNELRKGIVQSSGVQRDGTQT